MPKNFSSFEQGDIVVADLLYSEQIGVKRRPAIVISNSQYNQRSEDLVLLKVSSKEAMTHYDVPLVQKDLVLGELEKESKIMADNPATVYKPLITKKIGKISDSKLAEVKQKVKKLYAL